MNTNNDFAKHNFNHRYGHYIKFYSTMRVIVATVSLSLIALTTLTIAPIYHQADSVNATTGTATAPTLTFTSTNATASVSLMINSAKGTFATSTEAQKAAFSISTNNYTGYTLNITASGNNTALSDANSHTIASINSTTPLSSFQDTGTTGQALNNKWGYIPSYYDSSINTSNYYPAPTSASTTTLRVTDSANDPDGISNPDEYTIGLGIRADYTNPSGTYTNSTFLIQYVANAVDYIIAYSADGVADVDGIPAAQGGSSTYGSNEEESVTLSSLIPTRTGYTFSGWCLGTLSNNGTTCTGTTFTAGSDFGIDKTTDNSSITLKALWTVNTYAITFTFDNTQGISDIVIKNAAGTDTIATISTTGDSVNLNYGTTYTIVPTIDTNSGYELDAITITSGAGTLSGAHSTNYTVGNGVGTVNVKTIRPVDLYNAIESISKGKQTAADLQVAITAPTSSDPSTDTSNSGVYEYDPDVFGAASDAASDHTIYYYRGILDSSFADSNNYGSSGDGAYYPNYVILDADGTKDTADTCWRIVRTTGSGGIKMIYNGKWTGSTCANATKNAQITTRAFSGDSSTYRQIVRVGYTYNSTYAENTASTDTIANVLGSNSNASVNNTDSNIKDYIENTWFSNIDIFENQLETSAGYCNDRTVYDNTSPYTLQPESTNIVTYGTSDLDYLRFGADIRNFFALSDNNNRTLTLNCARNVVDLYTVQGSTNGNGQMSKPAALLTADEVAFSGSGSSSATQGSAYNASSFLGSGLIIWLISPSERNLVGNACGFYLSSSAGVNSGMVHSNLGLRPAISLIPGTIATSGSGTATDPWIVTAP